MPGPLGPAPKDTYPAINAASASVRNQTITIRAPPLVSGPEGPPDMLAHNVRQEQDGILLCQCDEALHAGGCCEYGGQSEEYPYCDFCCPGFCGCDCHACSNGIPEIGSVDYPCICVSGDVRCHHQANSRIRPYCSDCSEIDCDCQCRACGVSEDYQPERGDLRLPPNPKWVDSGVSSSSAAAGADEVNVLEHKLALGALVDHAINRIESRRERSMSNGGTADQGAHGSNASDRLEPYVPSKYIFPRNTGCACYHLKNGEHLQCTELVMQRTSDISWRSLFCELCYQHNGVDICLCECAGCMPKSTDAASTDGNAFPAEELVSIPEGAPAPDPVCSKL